MKYLKKISIFIITVLLIFYFFDLGYLLKAVKIGYSKGHTTAFLSDFVHFNNNIIDKGTHQPWLISSNYNSKEEPDKLRKLNISRETVSFLVIQNDSIVFEKYYRGYHQDSISNSFSMAKSYVNALLGKAIMDGYIKGLDQPVSDFFKEFKTGKAAKLTVGDLSSMSSGLNFVEEYYSPFSITAKSYFTSDLESLILGLKVVDIPGEKWKYLSSDTQLLGMVIKKASGQTLSNYLSNSFWKPMGSKNSAKWQIDSDENSLEKAFCCIASNARDFARIGKLYRQNGKWNGEILLDSSFVAKSIKPRFKDSKQYGFGWWLANYNDKDIFYARGHLGQMVIVIPQDELIIVRLGNLIAKEQPYNHSKDFFSYIDAAYEIIK